MDFNTPEKLIIYSNCPEDVQMLVGFKPEFVPVNGLALVELKLGEIVRIFRNSQYIGCLRYSNQRIVEDTVIPEIERSFDPENRLRGLSIFDPDLDLDSDVTWAFSIESQGGGDSQARSYIDLAQENSRASKKAREF